jgi:hypothetical protein
MRFVEVLLVGLCTPHVTNNEFNVWFVKTNIAQKKGVNVNWVKATTLTTR